MKKQPIGILDGGLEGIDIFTALIRHYPEEWFVYTNDLAHYPYEDKDGKFISQRVKENIDLLLSYNIRLLVVVNNSIIEYCDEYLKSLSVPVLKLNEVLIDYVNRNYEHKSILFLAKRYIIKANLYQKHLRYNRLYPLESDRLEELIEERKPKTAASFETVKEMLMSVRNKDYGVLVYVDAFISNLRLEFNEYLKCHDIVTPEEAVIQALAKECNPNIKEHRKSVILGSLSLKEFREIAYWPIERFIYRRIL